MPLKGIPNSITPELLYALAKMGHGDYLVIADSNFPSDSIAASTICKQPIRIYNGTTTVKILEDILKLITIDTYSQAPAIVMDRVKTDKEIDLYVPTYELLDQVINSQVCNIPLKIRTFYSLEDSVFAMFIIESSNLYPDLNLLLYLTYLLDKNDSISMMKFNFIYYDRDAFYQLAKSAYCIVQTNDSTPYANILIYKGVI